MFARRTRDTEHIIERHGDVSENDLGDGSAQALARGLAGHGAVAIKIGGGERLLCGMGRAVAKNA